jgi:hypothetical protein
MQYQEHRQAQRYIRSHIILELLRQQNPHKPYLQQLFRGFKLKFFRLFRKAELQIF